MVQHPDVDQGQGVAQGLGEQVIGMRGLHRPRGVVVGQHHRAGAPLQGLLHDLSGVDAGLSERAAKHLRKTDQAMLRIQKQHPKHLMRSMGQMQLHIALDQIGLVHGFSHLQLLGHGTA